MNEFSTILSDMVERLFSESITPELLAKTEDGSWPEGVWNNLQSNGLTAMLALEEENSSTMGWGEVFIVAKSAGRYGLPLPLMESIAATWLLTKAGFAIPEGITGLAGFHSDDTPTLIQTEKGWKLSGLLHRIPWGRYLQHVVIVTRHDDATILALVPLHDSLITPGNNLVGEPRDTILFHSQPVHVAVMPDNLSSHAVRLLGAAIRSAQMSGAIERILQQSISYAGERQQFGRAIGAFQAVQHMLALLAEESAAASVAANHAFLALDRQRDFDFAAAVAKVRTGDAAKAVIALSHQVHGAIGFAHEYILHHLTRRLMAWRAEFGTEADWAQRLAARAVPLAGAVPFVGEDLWSFVTSVQSDGSQKEFSYE